MVKRAEPIDLKEIRPVIETIEGYSISVDPFYFKELSKAQVTSVKFKDLPSYRADFFEAMTAQIENKLRQNSALANEIQEQFGQNYEEVKTASLGHPFLPNLLKVSKDAQVVPLINAKLIAIIAYLDSFPDESSPEAFSEKEEAFLRLLASIQECSIGEREGVENYYFNMDPDHKIKTMTTERLGDVYLTTFLIKQVANMLSGTNHYFQELIKEDHEQISQAGNTNPPTEEEVKQASHQARYVKNLIGDDVGLRDSAIFDSHTQVLSLNLVARSKLDVMQRFYRHLKPSDLTANLQQEVKAEILKEEALKEKGIKLEQVSIREQLTDLLDHDDKYKAWDPVDYHLTEEGAILLLLKTGALHLRMFD